MIWAGTYTEQIVDLGNEFQIDFVSWAGDLYRAIFIYICLVFLVQLTPQAFFVDTTTIHIPTDAH